MLRLPLWVNGDAAGIGYRLKAIRGVTLYNKLRIAVLANLLWFKVRRHLTILNSVRPIFSHEIAIGAIYDFTDEFGVCLRVRHELISEPQHLPIGGSLIIQHEKHLKCAKGCFYRLFATPGVIKSVG